jgi:hypothetical protein
MKITNFIYILRIEYLQFYIYLMTCPLIIVTVSYIQNMIYLLVTFVINRNYLWTVDTSMTRWFSGPMATFCLYWSQVRVTSLLQMGRPRGLCTPPRRGNPCCQPSNALSCGVRLGAGQSSGPMFDHSISTQSVRNRCLLDPWLCTRIGNVVAWCARGNEVNIKNCE